ncbi:oligodendrocyte-myelin glycoprotein-like isoform X2 [Mugil cephalus]|uniref:oligodendrocyte-myelin glycoprotein-like isoform X2 n=1 Tax=Mugil cephalus TaxID=48193 RepID=UPI001FB820E9|nr:oligodendrocyte-myelin glycoprotein-like isoform X2 [Mugil cephalus]
MRRHVLLKPSPNEALLELVLVLCLGLRVLAVCPSECSCTHSHREVDCSWRSLRQLPEGLQYNLLSLNLSHNRLHNLGGELAAYTHLRILDLSHNRLSQLPKDLPRSLWQLHAASNHIQLLDKNDTAYQWNLRMLDLSSNKLERAIFINNTLINLCTLNLSRNHFWTLPTNLPAHLETIDLSHNLLVKVLPGSLDRLARLTHFHLHANRFSTLPTGVLDKVTSLRVITLGSNPWACHLYENISYLMSWTQQTPARVLGCPCHTQPVCGGVRSNKTGGWHFASYNLPPLAASAQDVSSTLHAPRETSNTQRHTFTARPITGSHLTINHLSASASPGDADHMWHPDSHLISSPTDSLHSTDTSSFSDAGLITETSDRDDNMGLDTDQFFTTESSSVQTKKTTTLRTRSVRRQNQPPSGSTGNNSPTLARSLHPFFCNMGLLTLILSHVL